MQAIRLIRLTLASKYIMLVDMSIWGSRKKQQVINERDDRYILCIDGGGMRGVVPAVLLKKLSDLLKDAGDDRPFYAHFDLIAGTSTGGLLALALAAPAARTGLELEALPPAPVYAPQEPQSAWRRFLSGPQQPTVTGIIPEGIAPGQLLNLYLESGKDIFPKSPSRPLSILGPIFTDKYDVRPLSRLLKRVFDDIPLSEATVPVMVVTYDTKYAKPVVMSSRDSHGFLMREAARATSAAPTFFSPAILTDRQEGKRLSLIDGGVIANNPILFAYLEAKKLYPDAKRFHVLSLSTASKTYTFDAEKTGGGVIGWLDPAKGAPIQKIYAQSQMQTSELLASGIPDLDYIRVHGEIGTEKVKMDDTSEHAMKLLQQGAEQIYQDNREKLQGFAVQLSKRTNFDQIAFPAAADAEADTGAQVEEIEAAATDPEEAPASEDIDIDDVVNDSAINIPTSEVLPVMPNHHRTRKQRHLEAEKV